MEVIFEAVGIQLSLGVSVLRTLRILRIIRLLRASHVFPILRNLKTMLYALTGSASAFGAAMIFLMAIVYIFALLFMQGVIRYCRLDEKERSVSWLEKLEENYGSLDKTFWTLIGSVTGGSDWIAMAEPLAAIGPAYRGCFLVYILFVMFALLNILNGIFVNAAMQSSAMNRELAIDTVMTDREDMIEGMVNLFMEADSDNSGSISWREFERYIQDEKIKAYFMALDLDISSVEKIFRLLDEDSNESLGLIEFVEGCIKLRGTAKMVDITLMKKEYAASFISLEEHMDRMANTIKALVSEFPKDIVAALPFSELSI
jgi:hypothetical protein